MYKLLVGLAISFSMLTAPGAVYAMYLTYHSTGQLGGINEVDINGTLWNASFFDYWSLSGQQTYDSNFAQDASSALRYQFTHDATLMSDYLPTQKHQFIWGCEYQISDCYLITPVFAATTTNGFKDSNGNVIYNYTVAGYQYIVGGTVVHTGYLTQNANYIYSWVQWTESQIVNEKPEPPIGGVLPEPGMFALVGLGLGLMGWVGRRRRLQAE